MKIHFYSLGEIADEKLKYAVILSRHKQQTVFVRHRERNTLEIPGGKREEKETIAECAERELREETGAKDFSLKALFVYGVEEEGNEDFGTVFFAEINRFTGSLESEIAEIFLLKAPPLDWTYPLIQPQLFEEARKFLS